MSAFGWKVVHGGKTPPPGEVVRPDERLGWGRTVGLGAQHVVAMFGATFVFPLIMGLNPNVAIMFSGIATILFLLIVGGKVPSYLGTSASFVAGVAAIRAQGGDSSDVTGAILVCGLVLAAVGLFVHFAGARMVTKILPPAVTGAVVMLIGFNLAPVAKSNFAQAPLTAVITLLAVILCTVLLRGILGRLSIFLGVVVGYVAAVLLGEVDFSAVADAAWVGLPTFTAPANPFENPAVWGVLPAFLPVVLVLIAENVGHIKGVAQMVEDPTVNRLTGRALLGDGLATMLAGFGGGSGTTTYGENIGVMAATRIYSTAAYWVAGLVAILLGLSPKIGAVINTIPAGVLGGVTTALYGLIGIIGVKIWIDNRVDFSRPVNQFTAATALIIGIADFTFNAGTLSFNGIALGTIAAIVIYHLMTWLGHLRSTR